MHYLLITIIKYNIIIVKSSLLNTIYNNISYDYLSKKLFICSKLQSFCSFNKNFAGELLHTMFNSHVIFCIIGHFYIYIKNGICLMKVKERNSWGKHIR